MAILSNSKYVLKTYSYNGLFSELFYIIKQLWIHGVVACTKISYLSDTYSNIICLSK